MTINLAGYDVLIDDEDYERVMKYTWKLATSNLRKDGKIYFYTGGKNTNNKYYTMLLHRYILGLLPRDGLLCDHVNCNTLDNRKDNLRKCSPMENSRNSKKKRINSIGYKGVIFDDRNGHSKYVARIKVNKRSVHLGSFETPEEAYVAYCEASKKYHGEFGRVE